MKAKKVVVKNTDEIRGKTIDEIMAMAEEADDTEEVDVFDDFMREMFLKKTIYNGRNNRILGADITMNEDGIRIDVGGSVAVKEAVCEIPGVDELIMEYGKKLAAVATEFGTAFSDLFYKYADEFEGEKKEE